MSSSGYPRNNGYKPGPGHGYRRSNDRPPQPPPGYDGDWDAYWASYYGRRRRDRENDSGYSSNRTSYDPTDWKQVAEDYREQIETLKQDKRNAAEDLAKEKERHEDSLQELQLLKQALKDERQKLAKECEVADQLRAALGVEFIRNNFFDKAITVYEPLVTSLRDRLHELEDKSRPDKQAIEGARQQLLDTEFKYAQALAGAGRDTDAKRWLSRVFEARRRGDEFCSLDSTREAHRALSDVLARSKSENDWISAQKMFANVLADHSLETKPAERHWLLHNIMQKARLLIKQKQYKEVVTEVKRMSRLHVNASSEQRKSLDTYISGLLRELHTLGRHDIASKVTTASMYSDTRLSEPALQSFATLDYDDLMQVWSKCGSVLETAEQRRAGWQLSSLLISAKQYVKAERILRLIPASNSSSSPSDDQVANLRSYALLELAVDIDGYRRAAQIAIGLFKKYGFRLVSQETEHHHVATVLGAIDGISRNAGRLSDPPPAFKEANTEFWLPIFDKAKQYTKEGRPADKSILTAVAETGRKLHSRWYDNAKARSKNPSHMTPSETLRKLASNAATAEGWIAKGK